MSKLLTETADYDEDGSWDRMSEGWPGIRGERARDMYVFANCVTTVPHGSYVLMSEAGRYGDDETYLRVHADYIETLRTDFIAAGQPTAVESIARRDREGPLLPSGNHDRAPRWW